MNSYGPRMTRKLTHAAIALLAVGLLAAGCGSDDDGDGDKAKTATTPPALTKAQYIERSDKICETSTTQIRAAGSKLRSDTAKAGTLPPQEQIVAFLKQTSVPTYQRMLEQLRALEPPPEVAADVDGYLGALKTAIDKVKADPTRYAKSSAADPFDEANARAKRLGLETCGA